MPIWLDYRERGLQNLQPTLQLITPPVGDIWIGDMSGNLLQEGGVILERKSLNDLEASIIDGRYEEQRGRMLAYANEQKVAVGYVIEGETAGFQGRRFTGDSVLKLISQIQFKHRIPVVQTKSLETTMALAQIMGKSQGAILMASRCRKYCHADFCFLHQVYIKRFSRFFLTWCLNTMSRCE